MKDTTTIDVIRWFILYVYILIVMMTFLICFVIALEAIGYVRELVLGLWSFQLVYLTLYD
jgi:hypothetical protein